MAAMLLEVKDTLTGGPISTYALSRLESLEPFVDTYRYRVRLCNSTRGYTALRSGWASDGVVFKGKYSTGILALWATALKAVVKRPDAWMKEAVRPASVCDRMLVCRLDDKILFTILQDKEVPGAQGVIMIPGTEDVGPQCHGFGNLKQLRKEKEANFQLRILDTALGCNPNMRIDRFGQVPLNKVACLKCSTVIESRTRHECVSCKCGAIWVDGGLDYCKVLGKPEYFRQVSSDTPVVYKR